MPFWGQSTVDVASVVAAVDGVVEWNDLYLYSGEGGLLTRETLRDEAVPGSFEQAKKTGWVAVEDSEPKRNGSSAKIHNGKQAQKTAEESGQISQTEAEMMVLDRAISRNWIEYEQDEDHTLLAKIMNDKVALEEKTAKYEELGGDRTQTQLLALFKRLRSTERKMQEISANMEAEVIRLESQIDSLKAQYFEIANDGKTNFMDYCRNELGELTIEVKMYRARWTAAMDPALQMRLSAVEASIDSLTEQSIQKKLSAYYPSGNVNDLQRAAKLSVKSFPSKLLNQASRDSDRVDHSAQVGGGDLERRKSSRLQLMATMVADESQFHPSRGSVNVQDKAEPDNALPREEIISFSKALYETVHRRVGDVPDMGLQLLVYPVKGDGRCLFRSVAKGAAFKRNRLAGWNESMERKEADRLRQRSVVEIRNHRELLQQFCVVEGDFNGYCQRMSEPRTFGGEPELLMLALILRSPIAVFIQNRYHSFQQIQVYGRQYTRDPINILYSDGIHYDCLLPRH